MANEMHTNSYTGPGLLLNRMRSTSDIQFFVCRSRIVPEPPVCTSSYGTGMDPCDQC